MKKTLSITILLIFAVVVLNMTFQVNAQTPVASPSAKIIYMSGDVEYLKSGSTKWQKANEDIMLETGDKIKTGEDSSAAIFLWDRSTLKMGEKSQIVLTNLSQKDGGTITKVKLELGKLWTNVDKFLDSSSSFEVDAPYTLAAVHGTAFDMDTDGQATKLDVWDGKVECGDASGRKWNMEKSWGVKCGQNGMVSSPRQFKPDESDKWQQWNLTMDKRIRQARQKLPRFVNLRSKTDTRLKNISNELKKLPPPKKFNVEEFKQKQKQRKERNQQKKEETKQKREQKKEQTPQKKEEVRQKQEQKKEQTRQKREEMQKKREEIKSKVKERIEQKKAQEQQKREQKKKEVREKQGQKQDQIKQRKEHKKEEIKGNIRQKKEERKNKGGAVPQRKIHAHPGKSR
ncbi:MAG: FecR domain-containing protein [Firmicutes bacterium]|nr:FecR domain-containing protein [Bacillota bacterium]